MAQRDEKGARMLDYSTYKPAGRDFEPPADMNDVSRSLDIGIRRLRGGRKATFPATAEGLEKFKEASAQYFEYLNAQNQNKDDDSRFLLPDVEGWCTYIGISRQTLHTYETSRTPDWTEKIQYTKTAIFSARKQLASYYKLSPTLEIFNLKNNYGYTDKSEVELTAVTKEQKQEAAIEAQLDENGLIWDEDLQEYIPAEERGDEL